MATLAVLALATVFGGSTAASAETANRNLEPSRPLPRPTLPKEVDKLGKNLL